MAFPVSPYIDQEDGALRVAGTRVGLSSIVSGFHEGESPDKIAQEFPTMSSNAECGRWARRILNCLRALRRPASN
jgi:uncharacterized protein (DUF433 family)